MTRQASRSIRPPNVQHYDHIIIGAGICGVTAAETVRRRAPDASILIIGDETHPLYSRVLLPHVIRGKVGEEKIYLTPDAALAERRIDVRHGVSVTHVDAATRTLTTSDANGYGFGTLLIATGSRPKALRCEGANDVGTHRLQTIEDVRMILAARRGGTAVVIGGGFIALELIMSYAHLGAKVVALLRKDGFYSSVLDDASKRAIIRVLEAIGVDVRTNITVDALQRSGDDTIVRMSDGTSIAAQVVGLGIGLDANIGFLKDSGIETRHGVVTDAALRTNVPGVYAAGDVAEFLDPFIGNHHLVGNWQNALFQGKLAGENMTGGTAEVSKTSGYSIAIFGTPVSFVGATDIVPDERVVRDDGKGSVLQLLMKDRRVMGATAIGSFIDRTWVNKLI